jgi:hypothetical protein
MPIAPSYSALVQITCSLPLGDHPYEIAVVALAVQLVASEAGFVLSAGALPRLGLGSLGGVYADQWDRRKTMLIVDLMRCGVVITLPIASFLGPISMWHLDTATTVLGGLSTLFDSALQDNLPMIANNTHTLQAESRCPFRKSCASRECLTGKAYQGKELGVQAYQSENFL